MLRSLKNLERYKVSASDGDIGSVADFLMDDERWVVRYLVADTGGFWARHEVLITPIAFREVDYSAQRFGLALTMDKVKNSPSIDTDLPVSGQHEKEYYDYYAYPFYWGCGGLWGLAGSPAAMMSGTHDLPLPNSGEEPGDVHLRSANAITGYHIEATDGAIGHIKDFIVDDETWRVCYIVVDTTDWWPGKSVLVAPGCATRISWIERTAHISLTRDAIQGSPAWTGSYPIERAYEEELALHYRSIPGWQSLDRKR